MAMSAARAAKSEQLKDRIVQCIADGAHFAPAIADQLGVSRDTINSALRRLELNGKIRHVRVAARVMGGFLNRWSLVRGDDPIDETEALHHGDQRVVKTHKIYPDVGRRDPLVAALFGEPVLVPKQSPHRCTACGAEQGGQHQRGCIVALVAA